MAGQNAMFIFEVVVENVTSLVESRNLVIRSDFGDVFSLELKDPKQMHIVIPEPPPLPPEPKGKKGKKKPPKKKGKKGQVELPPPEPAIQSGQSVLFGSSAEVLLKTMKNCPMEVSLWSKEDNLSYIGNSIIPWDPMFITYLQQLYNCEDPPPPTLNEEYNIFQEGKAKLMAKIKMQVKLTHLGEKVTTAFRTLSEDPANKKYLYTGVNSKVTSFICTLKTTDEEFNENVNKIENQFIKDLPKQVPKIAFADYKNAPGANVTFFSEGDYCCMAHADKPPESIYKSPETVPDVDFICDYVRKIITSCNDNMRMLTPRQTIRPRIKATDIDRLCFCKETKWPDGPLAQRFKKEALTEPCPLCINAGKKIPGARGTSFDIANIRGPCGRPDCKIARHLRAYIEELVKEDDEEINISEVIGPCGSKKCTLAEKIQEFLRHEGVFSQARTINGLSTQCACLLQMQDILSCKKENCDPECTGECSSDGSSNCGGKGCPLPNGPRTPPVYNVYYFTVELIKSLKSGSSASSKISVADEGKFKSCPDLCPFKRSQENVTCSQSMCNVVPGQATTADFVCHDPTCPIEGEFPPSPADSDVELSFDNIKNLCCVKTCEVAEKVKDFISDNLLAMKGKLNLETDDPCFCDCDCTFKFSKKTTYCAICGGYECISEDMENQPEYSKPHPCPFYHKMYDRKKLNVPDPWPEDEDQNRHEVGSKPSKTGSRGASSIRSMAKLNKDVPGETKLKKKSNKELKKKVGKFTANVEKTEQAPVEKKPEPKYPYPAVPKHMGWNWTAEDIPGMKPRPKWKPGAANKILVRRYRAAREGVDLLAKKKRAMMNRKKKLEMKPTLVVTKHDGEYTVQMEVFKKYSKERLPYQYPYEETKPPLVYTIGKTEAEKKKIQTQRERRERRETRRKSRLIQSTFRDKCQEICLKAYNQAIGVLPLPNPNDPDCPCNVKNPNVSPPIDSCSCSDEGSIISSSDTDHDDWVIEFTPPIAKWDAKIKHFPGHVENESQYNYMDYRVKLSDKQGNPVPRYFKGPDGRQECSDLGGFWGPNHVWMEINKDGYIGLDGRWVPMNFIGPDGMFYSAEDGFFTDSSGQNIKIGVDGYVDAEGKWVWYPRRKPIRINSAAASKFSSPRRDSSAKAKGKNVADSAPKKRADRADNKSPASVSTVKPKTKKAASGSTVKGKAAVVMSASALHYMRNYRTPRLSYGMTHGRTEENKKLARYREIMNQLSEYEDICALEPQRKAAKTNRACNTPIKRLSPLCLFKPNFSPKKSFINSSCVSSKS